jgi:hypothetical protein
MNEDQYINDIPTDIPSMKRQSYTVPSPVSYSINTSNICFQPDPQAWTNIQPPPYLLLTRDQIADIVAQGVRKALHPDGLPDETRFLQVEAKDQDGNTWCGTLYAMKEVEVPE